MNNEVLVIGGDHQNPLGVVESLASKGIHPFVIVYEDCRDSFVLKSKFIKKGWICRNSDSAIRCILDNFSHFPQKMVAITCSDNAASLLNDNLDILADILILPGMSRQYVLKEWTNKEKMTENAELLGLTVPKSWIVSKSSIPEDLIYPCITKSITSINNGKTEFSTCHNRGELIDFLNNKAHSDCIQVQQFIDKEFEFQYLGCSLEGGNKIIIPGRTHIDAAKDFNNLTFLKYQESKVVESPTVLQKTEEFIRVTGYSGLFSVEFMHGKDGKDYFLEMNFRNDGNGVVVTAAGTNLPYIWYLYNTGGDYQKEISASTVKETYFVPELYYFIIMLLGDVKFKVWLNNVRKAGVRATYFSNDTKPFWSLLWSSKYVLFKCVIYFVLTKLHILKKKNK